MSKYSLRQTGDVEENAFFFRHVSQLRHKFQRRKKKVTMKTTGYEMLCVSVMLCITANDNKLSPYIKKVKGKAIPVTGHGGP
jgi:hypothetical protein